ncbi:hypothetical protein FOZ63_027732 [Perkinsus olseni]|uniref:Uncharacterized protein n=1 Tax=Perkinsus olseni TaxID=32597 RepID=A0A7J6N772_PEROL|nr:hypothetical protein FOZ60_014837 [Perkinsus olseni]KAF4714580.1 hypothetical protein FOZ62_029276 [Perkinsus olseni]KAF4730091.1 hypothetical protein FOZ63_027732 [Perkinsus olseni]
MGRQHRELSATEIQDRVKKIIEQGGALLRGRQNKTAREVYLSERPPDETIRQGGRFCLHFKACCRSSSAASASKPPPANVVLSEPPACSAEPSVTPESCIGVEGTHSSDAAQCDGDSPLDSRDSGYPYDVLGTLTEPSCSAQSSPASTVPPKALKPGASLLEWASKGSTAADISDGASPSQRVIPWSTQETVGCGTCPKYQADYVLGEITRKASSSTFAGWIRVDYPSMSKAPDVSRYLLRDTYIFNPLVEFKELLGVKSLPCPGCGGTLTVQGLSSHGPRICVDFRKDFWVWPVTLVCTGPCAKALTDRRKRFLSLADEFMAAMPEEVLRSVPFVPSGPGGKLFSREVLTSVRQIAGGGNTLGHITQQINANHVEDYLERRTRYTDHCTARRSSHGMAFRLQKFFSYRSGSSGTS